MSLIRGGASGPRCGRTHDGLPSRSTVERSPAAARLPWVWAAVLAAVQTAALLLLPATLCLAVAVMLALLTVAGLVGAAAWKARPRRVLLPPIPTPRSPFEPGATNDPSPELFLATRLARQGVDAERIAEHCAIPRALADFVVEFSGREEQAGSA
jgi:hypothetical protein